jgi:hypothetical protein
MIDLSTEIPIPLAEAARLIPPARGGKRTHLSTLLRWILTGCTGPGGETVRLEGQRLGSRWVTSQEAIQRFMAALTPHLGTNPGPAPRTSAQRRRSAERAERDLGRIGI